VNATGHHRRLPERLAPPVAALDFALDHDDQGRERGIDLATRSPPGRLPDRLGKAVRVRIAQQPIASGRRPAGSTSGAPALADAQQRDGT